MRLFAPEEQHVNSVIEQFRKVIRSRGATYPIFISVSA